MDLLSKNVNRNVTGKGSIDLQHKLCKKLKFQIKGNCKKLWIARRTTKEISKKLKRKQVIETKLVQTLVQSIQCYSINQCKFELSSFHLHEKSFHHPNQKAFFFACCQCCFDCYTWHQPNPDPTNALQFVYYLILFSKTCQEYQKILKGNVKNSQKLK